MPKGFQGDPWLAQRRSPQHGIPKAIRASMKLPGLSPHPKPPPPQELGAAPIFHPFCFNPSARPLEIPTATPGPAHFMVQSTHSHTGGARRVDPTTRPAALVISKNNPHWSVLAAFFWMQPQAWGGGTQATLYGAGPTTRIQGHPRASLALAGERGQPPLPKTQGEDSEGGGMSSSPATTSGTRGGC